MCDHSPNREAAMVIISDGVWCDPCIEPLVRALNDGGLQTIASCCGHGRRPGRVSLADGREVLLTMDTDEADAILCNFPDINAGTKSMTPEELHLRMIRFESRVSPGVEGITR